MEPEEVADRIEAAIPDAEATVSRTRDDDDHLAAEVVSPAFEDESLVDRHSMVYDALDDAVTTDVHALEVSAYTPDEARE